MAVRELNLGLKWLFPGGAPGVDWDLVDDGAGPYIAAWHRTEPQPSDTEIDTAIAAAKAAAQQAVTDAASLKQAIINQAQSAVGVLLTDLTAAQRNALVACLLWKAGALDKTLKIKPLASWLTNGS